MGHFAIALGARRYLHGLPLAWLLLLSVAPDLGDVLLALWPALATAIYPHGLFDNLLAALLVGVLSLLIWRRVYLALGSAAVLLSHLLADYLTSRLPLWPDGPLFGLHWYLRPWLDFALETALIGAALALYARSGGLRAPLGRGLAAMALILVGLQAVWDFGFHPG